jgi:predicted molibdopterin-dependent oxidoreductase YjgC
MTVHLPLAPSPRPVELSIDGCSVTVCAGQTLLDACRKLDIDVPTLCHAPNLTPVNVCRLCVVELEGARALVPACSRRAEPGMVVHTDSARVRLARKVVLELLASSVDLSATPGMAELFARYHADPSRMAPGSTRAEPVKVDNDLFVRDYAKCVLCYKCVEACGADAQNTFAIAVAGRGFAARIATEHDVPLPDSACVFCGNCIGVCPTGALMFKTEHDLRREGRWDEDRQTRTNTVCGYCGVGCVITLHVQDGRIVKATSPTDSSVTQGHLCVKGRFGWAFVGE